MDTISKKSRVKQVEKLFECLCVCATTRKLIGKKGNIHSDSKFITFKKYSVASLIYLYNLLV